MISVIREGGLSLVKCRNLDNLICKRLKIYASVYDTVLSIQLALGADATK
jgi:hypothetical protein